MQNFIKQIVWYQKSMAVTTLQIMWKLEQEDEGEEQKNKKIGGSGKGRNIERGADAEMVDV